MRPALQMQNDLHGIEKLLRQGAFYSLSVEERERLREGSQRLVRKLEAIGEGCLVAGLLGGTGVGKSSLMNALAGAPIASTSHRRPHTDQVLIYHHQESPLPQALTMSSPPWHEITHDAEAARHLLLCDLPDFDSLLSAHRDQVLQFLEHLDLLIWVTTPEKYADAKFYEFLRQVSKAKQNFYFLLNKADLLFPPGEQETGHSQMSTVLSRFSGHLRDNGIARPVVYAVSAREGCDADKTSPWNHLWNFRNQIFRLRDAKEMREIKGANLDVELQQLTAVLEKEASGLNVLKGVIDDTVAELRNRRAEWCRMGHDAVQRSLEQNPEEYLQQPDHPSHTSALVGMGRGIATVAGEWKRFVERSDDRWKSTDLLLHHPALQSLHHELERIENRMIHQALYRGLPPSMGNDEAVKPFDADVEWQELSQKLQAVMRESSWIAPSFKGFRVRQYASYLTVLFLLLVALSGEAPLKALWEQPDWHGVLSSASALIQTLFSPRGFAALGTYLLLQVFLGLRFYRRYKALLQRHAKQFVESLKLVLNKTWEEELDIVIDRLTHEAREIDRRITALQELRSPHSNRF